MHLSSDKTREMLFGDANCQDKPNEVFDCLYKSTTNCLCAGINVVYDATNLCARRRQALINRIRRCLRATTIHFKAVVIACPIEICIERDKRRSRHVGEEVIMKQLRNFQVPTAHEGWDSIDVIYTCDDYVREEYAVDYVVELETMHHDNPHHNDTVWHHSIAVADTMETLLDRCVEDYFVTEPIEFVRSIGLLHDIGKIMTKTFDDDNIAHYFGHDNASAYLSLFFNPGHFSSSHLILRAAVIGWHMRHFSYKVEEKYRAWLGTLTPSELSLLSLLVDADKKNSIP